MGWPFGGRKVTTVGTAISRVVEDDLLPDLPRTSVVKAVLAGTDIPGTMMDDILSSTGYKCERAFKHATSGDYFNGATSHAFLNDQIGRSSIQSILNSKHGQTVAIQYSHFAGAHNIHLSFQILTETQGYDEVTNTLNYVINGEPVTCRLEHMVGVVNLKRAEDFEDVVDPDLVYPTADAMALYEASPNERYTPWVNTYKGESVWYLGSYLQLGTNVHYAYEDEGGTIHQRTAYIDLDDWDDGKAYFQAKYIYYEGGARKVGYFTYEFGEGTYPVLDNILNVAATTPQFMPTVLFRHDAKNVADIPIWYEGSKKIARIIGMNYDELSEAIHDEENNPKVFQIEECTLMFGIPLDTQEEMGRRYIYEFFKWVAENDTSQAIITSGNANSTFYDEVAAAPQNRGLSFEDKNTRMQLNYGGIGMRSLAAMRLDEVGEVRFALRNVNADYEVQKALAYAPGSTSEDRTKLVPSRVFVLTIEYQETSGMMHEIAVASLENIFRIRGKNEIVSSSEIETLTIPLHHGLITEEFTLFQRDRLYAMSMHFRFNSRVVTKIPWYATSFFKFVMIIVAVVVTVWSAGTAAPAVKAAWAAYALAYGALAATVIIAIQYLAVNYLVSIGFKFVAQELGAEAALVIAVIAMAYGMYSQSTGSTFGTNLVKMSSNLMEAATSQVNAELQDVVKEMEQFKTESEEKQEALDEQIEALALEVNDDLLEVLIMQPMYIQGETPSDFYSRTIESGNIGTLAYDYIENYVDINTRLPTIEETIKGFERDG